MPGLLGAFLGALGALAGAYVITGVEETLIPAPHHLPVLLDIARLLGLWWGIVFAGLMVGLALAECLASAFTQRLARRAEDPESPPPGWRAREVLAGAARAALLLAATPFVVALGLVPVAGPLLAGLAAGAAFSYEQTEAYLGGRGVSGASRRRWRRENRPEALGLGLAAALLLLSPGANLLGLPLVLPALAVGTARLAGESARDAPAESAPGETRPA